MLFVVFMHTQTSDKKKLSFLPATQKIAEFMVSELDR